MTSLPVSMPSSRRYCERRSSPRRCVSSVSRMMKPEANKEAVIFLQSSQ